MSYKTLLTKEYLEERLTYDPHTGHLTWKDRVCKDGRPFKLRGQRAGGLSTDGYRKVAFKADPKGCQVYEHRLIWFMQTGEWPDIVDHRDGDKANNKWDNLRKATKLQNGMNRKRDGVGIRCHKRGTWGAEIFHAGTRHHLGTFQTEAEAIAARHAAEIRLRGEWRRE